MTAHQTKTARPKKVAVNNEHGSQPEAAEALAEAKAYEQQYLYHLERLVWQACDKSSLEIGRTLIREGAVALGDSPDYFDRSGRITAKGLEAIIAGGLCHVWRALRQAMQNWRGLTLTEINAIREYRRVPTLLEHKVKK